MRQLLLDLPAATAHSAADASPVSLTPLVDQGIIQEVVRPLMSGKEAQIYLVVSGDELRVAKVYKEAHYRTFRQRAEYTEGRGVRNTRTQRAKNKRSRYGRAQDEEAWRSAEVDIIYRLRAAGVRVPEPHYFADGVLVMELVTDADGDPAPRLADVTLGRASAREVYASLLSEVVKMLHAGVVHGDLSEFNVLLGQDGPVIIDFPQSVDPAHNQNARKLLIRDVDNLGLFVARIVPGRRRKPYGQELWELYATGELTPDTQLTGRYRPPRRKANTSSVMYEIESAAREAERRNDAGGQSAGQGRGSGRRSRRRRRKAKAASETAVVVGAASAADTAATTAAPAPKIEKPATPTTPATPTKRSGRRRRRRRPRSAQGAPSESASAGGAQAKSAPATAAPAAGARASGQSESQAKESPPGRRRRRRRRRRRGGGASGAGPKTS